VIEKMIDCVANGILKRSSKIIHFEESYIKDPKIKDLVQKIYVIPDPALQAPGSERSLSSDVTVTTKTGKAYDQFVKAARGMPGNSLSKDEHLGHFQDCMGYAKKPLPKENINKIITLIDRIEEVEDIRNLIALLSVSDKRAG
jgi:2-methylcitrate dehydratase PrpD